MYKEAPHICIRSQSTTTPQHNHHGLERITPPPLIPPLFPKNPRVGHPSLTNLPAVVLLHLHLHPYSRFVVVVVLAGLKRVEWVLRS